MRKLRIDCRLTGWVAALSLSLGAGALAHAQTTSTPAPDTAALATLARIADLAKKPDTRHIDRLAADLHFSYRLAGCNKTEQFDAFCQYQVTGQAPASGQVLVLALGEDTATGTSGGRIVWGPGSDGGCIPPSTVARLFGAGAHRSASMPEPLPGQPAPRTGADTEEVIYRSVPDAATPASAVVSFRNRCVKQVFLDF